MMAGMAVLHDMIGRAVWEEPGWRVGAHTNSGPQPWNRAEYVVIHYTAAAGAAIVRHQPWLQLWLQLGSRSGGSHLGDSWRRLHVRRQRQH
jgi:hypothetical protein